MPKLHLRTAAAAACLLVAAAAPAAGQSARQTVTDTINAIHEEERSRASAHYSDDAADARIQELREIEQIDALIALVRPSCAGSGTTQFDLRPRFRGKQLTAALAVCRAMGAAK